MPFDFGGFADIASNFDFGDIDFGNLDVGSLVDDFGTEFLSSDFSFTDFGVSLDSVSDLGGWSEIGSFAGDANWFDTFNPGAILDSLPSVGDFNLGSITDSLPSLSSIKGTLSTVTSSVQGVTSTAQSVIKAYDKVAPTVNAVSSALGVQNPLNQIVQPIKQATSLANGLASTAAGVSTGIDSAVAGVNRVTSTASNLIATAPTSVSSAFNRVTSTASSLFTTEPTAANAVNTATGLPINTPREVDEFGLTILNQQETAQLTRNATLVNSLTDPGTQSPIGYTQAVANRDILLANQADIENSIRANERVISDANLNISEMEQNLLDPDLSDSQRARLQLQIDANQATIAEATANILANQQSLNDVTNQIQSDNAIIVQTNTTATTSPDAVDADNNTYYASQPSVTVNSIVGDPGAVQGIALGPLVSQLKQQQTLRDLRQTKAQSSDWRVRLRLAPGATYLYNDPNGAGILDPLKATDGVIFPYTPAIETAYKANYDSYDLTHSNFRGYFYKNSYVDAVNLRCTFTAQDTQEANYLLATIHFFRSVTKMFYGQDPERGSPPPMVFLSGLGDYQFNEHPSVVSQFNYTLPADVDYIRAYSTLDMSTNLLNNRTRTSIPGNPLSYAANRLLNSGLFTGAQPSTRTIGNLPIKEPTYVPTKIEISITLLPMQSRQQISNQFSLKGFANGNLLKGGFW